MITKTYFSLLLLSIFIVPTQAQNQRTTSYDKLILELYEKDQSIRKKLSLMEQNPQINQQDLVNLYMQASKIDQENQRKALPLLDRYLSQQIHLNNHSLVAMYYIIQHAGQNTQNKYREFVDTLYHQKLISSQEYGWFIDRVNVGNNLGQIYGLQVKSWLEKNDSFPFPILIDSTHQVEQHIKEQIKEYLYLNFLNEYAPVYFKQSEFVVFGHVSPGIDKTSTIEITTDKTYTTSVNSKGFYVIKINKTLQEITVNLKVEQEIIQEKTLQITDKNWVELDFD